MSPQDEGSSEPSQRPRLVSPVVSILDASAVLALLFREEGADEVADAIVDGAAISTVNLSEVGTILTRRGQAAEPLLRSVSAQVDVMVFTAEDAIAAATLSVSTRSAGLSLADRACLALAQRLGARAVTADFEWTTVKTGVEIQLIRRR